MLRISNLRIDIKENIDLKEEVAKKLHIKTDMVKDVTIYKKSIDSRSIDKFSYVYELDVLVDNETKYLGKNVTIAKYPKYELPKQGNIPLKTRPIIVGSGPAGVFLAYMLAKYGYKPIIIERGKKVEDRIIDVNNLWDNLVTQENSNVQFGEGGAGTFSDGKLNTLVKDKYHRMREVFKIFVECGAPKEIMYESKPHIGTDKLREVIVNLRNKIISYGGEFHYESTLEDIVIKDNRVTEVVVNGENIKTDILILAIGHSARDTFRMLEKRGLNMAAKPFAIGLRIIHPQDLIDENQYPINYPFLPASSYKLTYQAKSGRGVYSFCMCPGGYVVDARSTKNGVCVNGMSNYKRDSGFANSAIIVTISPKDFGNKPLDGVKFQETFESKAYALGKGLVPIQRYIDFKNNKVSEGINIPAFKGQVSLANLRELYPTYITDSLIEGIEHFGKLIKGFNGDSAVLAGPEARTSSPVKILRNEELESNILGIYPIGEGSGYAGGITTSAMDALKCFESIYQKYMGF